MESLTLFEEWVAKARKSGPSGKQLAENAIPLLRGSKFLINANILECDKRGHWLVDFWPPVPKNARPVREARQMKLGHAVVTALIEKGGGRVRFRISKLTHGESRSLYRPKIDFADPTMSFTLPRVLFGDDFEGGYLRELKDSFRSIVPDSFRYERTNDRQDLLRRVSPEKSKLLIEVFAFCDNWYRDELQEMMSRPS